MTRTLLAAAAILAASLSAAHAQNARGEPSGDAGCTVNCAQVMAVATTATPPNQTPRRTEIDCDETVYRLVDQVNRFSCTHRVSTTANGR